MEDTDSSLRTSSMDSDTSSARSTEDTTSTTPRQRAPFAVEWSQNDSAHLAPSNLPVTKVQRAWERKPQSPFSRKKVRFGKVWKRTNAPSVISQNTGMPSAFHALQMIGGASPAKIIKKMRVGEDGEEVVRNWEGRSSPTNRRIVTRSNTAEEPLLELEDHGALVEQDVLEFEKETVTRVEVSYEDGRVEELGVQEELEQDDWEDESVTEEDISGWDRLQMQREIEPAENQDPLESDPLDQEPVTQPSEVIAEPAEQSVEEAQQPQSSSRNEEIEVRDESSTNCDLETKEPKSLTSVTEANDTLQARQPERLAKQSSSTSSAIPEGFITPVKGRRRTINQARQQANANRRKSLPAKFASDHTAPVTPQPEVSDKSSSSVEASSTVPGHTYPSPHSDDASDEQADSQSVISTAEPAGSALMGLTLDQIESDSRKQNNHTPDAALSPRNEQATIDENLATPPRTSDEEDFMLQVNPTIAALVESQASPSKRSCSPTQTFDAPPPSLPLRRSPRRQSSTPLKRSTILPSMERSHLVAFTPLKYPGATIQLDQLSLSSSPLPDSPTLLLDSGNVDESQYQIIRSSSAPPEEPQMSPRKPFQPRMSDDTATLQAFIKRAEESKNGRRVSVARRESIENCRNSETVRQALASPEAPSAPTDVLADLDPNSPSPRKSSASVQPEEKQTSSPQSDEEETLLGKKSSRRSGRAKKKPQILAATTYSGPTKISVRGGADSVVLKKSEAQEIATLTRNNTRKNKSGAVLPPQRLTKMAQENGDGNAELSEQGKETSQPGRKSVTWSETLESFYQGEAGPETSIMTDELIGPEPEAPESTGETASKSTNPELVGVPTAPPPPSGTPAKPRLRRLKPPRTASTPAKAAPTEPPSARTEGEKIEESAQPKSTNQRRTRTGTPAKLGGESLLPDGLQEEAPQQVKPPVVKKPMVSKLPAPTPISAFGKENSRIGSPPKKRTKHGDSSHAPAHSTSMKLVPPRFESIKPLTGPERKPTVPRDSMPGLASPAKKGLRPVVFAGTDENGHARSARDDLPPSLGSPAKKRAKRALG